jgi:hypothetical protein
MENDALKLKPDDVRAAFDELSKLPRYQGKWRADDAWAETIKTLCCHS